MNKHLISLYENNSQKLNALLGIAHPVTFDQRRLILNYFLILHFSFCPIARMFHSRKLNKRTTNIHERNVRIVIMNYYFSIN